MRPRAPTWPQVMPKSQNKNFARVSPVIMPPKRPQKRRSFGNPPALGALPCFFFFFTVLPPPGWSLINQRLSFTPELPHLCGAARHQTWAVNINRTMEEQHAHAKKNQQLKRNRKNTGRAQQESLRKLRAGRDRKRLRQTLTGNAAETNEVSERECHGKQEIKQTNQKANK